MRAGIGATCGKVSRGREEGGVGERSLGVYHTQFEGVHAGRSVVTSPVRIAARFVKEEKPSR